MTKMFKKGNALAFGLLALVASTPCFTATANAADYFPDAHTVDRSDNPQMEVDGMVDFYYSTLLNNPKNIGSGIQSMMPAYAMRNQTPTLALGELNVTKDAPTKGGFGGQLSLQVGDVADLGVAEKTNSEEARYKNIGQLFGTYAFPKGGDINVGKVFTPFCFEDISNNLPNDFNYSRSIPYTDLLPTYNAGVWVDSPMIDKGLTLSAFVVNSLNNTDNEGVSDDNNTKGYIGEIKWLDPAGKFMAWETYGHSKDLNAFPGKIFAITASAEGLTDTDDCTISDASIMYNVSTRTTLGLNWVNRKDNMAAQVEGESLPINASSNGVGLYCRRQTTKLTYFAVRYSEDLATLDIAGSSSLLKEQEATLTYGIHSGESWLTKIEYRHDWTNKGIAAPLYYDTSGNLTKQSEDTLTVGMVYSFK